MVPGGTWTRECVCATCMHTHVSTCMCIMRKRICTCVLTCVCMHVLTHTSCPSAHRCKHAPRCLHLSSCRSSGAGTWVHAHSGALLHHVPAHAQPSIILLVPFCLDILDIWCQQVGIHIQNIGQNGPSNGLLTPLWGPKPQSGLENYPRKRMSPRMSEGGLQMDTMNPTLDVHISSCCTIFSQIIAPSICNEVLLMYQLLALRLELRNEQPIFTTALVNIGFEVCSHEHMLTHLAKHLATDDHMTSPDHHLHAGLSIKMMLGEGVLVMEVGNPPRI